MAALTSSPKAPPLRRWGNVALRGLHLIAVIVLGAGLLGAPVATGTAAMGAAITGVVMLILDTWTHPNHLREAAGFAMLVKIALVAWMALDANIRPLLFWFIVAGSALFAHAPARFRHVLVLGRPKTPAR
jgi:hypothetical protein